MMKLTWDEEKRQKTLQERRLDFADAGRIIEGTSLTFPDQRKDYGEDRFVTVGFLDTRMLVIVHTQRGDATRIISMRKANEREIEHYRERQGRPG
jgi:uncharacterized DUF497 family protein